MVGITGTQSAAKLRKYIFVDFSTQVFEDTTGGTRHDAILTDSK